MAPDAAPVEVVRGIYAAWQRGEQPWHLIDEDIVWDCPVVDGPAEKYRGHAGVTRFFRSWLGTWDEYSFGLEDVEELSDGRIRTRFWERGRGKGSGAPVELRMTGHWTIANGKAVHYQSTIDTEKVG